MLLEVLILSERDLVSVNQLIELLLNKLILEYDVHEEAGLGRVSLSRLFELNRLNGII